MAMPGSFGGPGMMPGTMPPGSFGGPGMMPGTMGPSSFGPGMGMPGTMGPSMMPGGMPPGSFGGVPPGTMPMPGMGGGMPMQSMMPGMPPMAGMGPGMPGMGMGGMGMGGMPGMGMGGMPGMGMGGMGGMGMQGMGMGGMGMGGMGCMGGMGMNPMGTPMSGMPGMPIGPNDMPGMIGLSGMAGLNELKLKDSEGNELTPEEIRDMDPDEMQELIEAAQEEALELRMRGGDTHHARLPEGISLYKLVRAHRPSSTGEMIEEVGVIHELHDEDATLTIQFVTDQNRRRMSVSEVKPVPDLTPYYKSVILKPGELPPTNREQDEEFDEEQRQRHLGLLPPQWQEIEQNQEMYEKQKKEDAERKTRHEQMRRWGMPAATMNALRNRSIPFYQVTGEYGEHFYSSLYKNNFYWQSKDQARDVRPQPPKQGNDGYGRELGPDGKPLKVGPKDQVIDPYRRGGNMPDGTPVASHHYVPLEGPVLEQDMDSGRWCTTEDHNWYSGRY